MSNIIQFPTSNSKFTNPNLTDADRDLLLLKEKIQTTEAALEYVTNPGKFYTLGQEAETVASINYGLTLIEKVLAQTAPAVNYQTTNGDNSTRVVPQYFETALGAQDTVVYDGVISGSSSGGTYSDETPEGGYAEGGGY